MATVLRSKLFDAELQASYRVKALRQAKRPLAEVTVAENAWVRAKDELAQYLEKERLAGNELKKSTPSHIYTKYLPVDKKQFGLQLQSIMQEASGEVQTANLNRLIKTISNKAVGRMASLVSRGDNPKTVLTRIKGAVNLSKDDLESIGNATRAVWGSFSADVAKAKALGKFDKDEFERRADLIGECEVARITNNASTILAKRAGIVAWIWGASGSANPREEHEVLYGVQSPVGETPAEGGEFPGELPNCNCQMIFVNI